MRQRTTLWVAFLAVPAFLAGGCGSITPSGLLMKGAMWAGEQVIKKELKKQFNRKHGDESDQATSRGHKRSSAQRSDEFGGPAPSSAPSE